MKHLPAVTGTKPAPVIVESEKAFVESLFKPINGRTVDGYVVKRSKWHADVFLAGRNFRVNKWGVWCMRNGDVWQHAVLELNRMGWGLCAMDEARRLLTISNEWVGREIAYTFKS